MKQYYQFSRSAYYGVVASLPLLLIYEMLLTLTRSGSGGQIRNAADVWLRTILASFGISPSQATIVMIFLVILAIPLVRDKETPLKATYLGWMAVEAVLYSFLLAFILTYILGFVFSSVAFSPFALPMKGGVLQGIALSTGAGLFEEFFFRVVLVWVLLFMGKLIMKDSLAAVTAIVGAAVLFSLAHYTGSMGEAFGWESFIFRFFAGLIFTLLYYWRGFAITAYAHALYDVWVITGVIG